MSEPAALELHLELSPVQRAARQRFRAFAAAHVAPFAADWDRAARLDPSLIAALRGERLLGSVLPTTLGGGGLDPITYGLLTEELGRACSSVRTLLTVHDMVCVALARWGGEILRQRVLPALARGEKLAALALSEPEAGSDAAGVTTEAHATGDGYELNGLKTWVSFGGEAEELLVMARCADQLTAFLVPSLALGLTRVQLPPMAGTRAARLASLRLEGCRVESWRRVGAPGFGLSAVFATALDHGRFSVAWGALGIAQACLDTSQAFVGERRQFGVLLADQPLVRKALTRMLAEVRAARLLCYRAGFMRQRDAPEAVGETLLAKYFSARAAVHSANEAVRLLGARGLSPDFPTERLLRDAKVTEIIEGTQEILETTLPGVLLAEL